MDQDKDFEQPDFTKLAVTTLIGAFILGLAVYVAYRYSQGQPGNIILPGGVTYLGPSPSQNPSSIPTPSQFTAPTDIPWKEWVGKNHPYSFSYPSSLPLVIFPNDPLDSVAIDWNNNPPQLNLLLNIEFIDQRDSKYLKLPKIEYVKNWYKFFSGLTGLSKVETFTNGNNLRGYKAIYTAPGGLSPNIDVFFEVPRQPNLMLHLASHVLDPSIFDRLVESLKWIPPTKVPVKTTP